MRAPRQAKALAIAGATAFVAAALVMVASALVVSRSDPRLHPRFTLAAGSGFTITSAIYASPACTGATALLYPGTTRCLVFTVSNPLSVPITVTSITMGLDGSFPPPPSGCAASLLSLPSFSGTLTVSSNGSASTAGLAILLKDSGTNQDNCENTTLHFAYSGSAQYTDTTHTSLGTSPNPSSVGQSVTLTATVTEDNASADPSGPTGTVDFFSCPTVTCLSTTLLGTGTLNASSQATFSTTTLPGGTDYLEAQYLGQSTNLSGSTSNVVTQSVNQAKSKTTLTTAAGPGTNELDITATVSNASGISGLPTPTGTVTFTLPAGYACAGGSNTVSLTSGKAKCAITLAANSISVTAKYSGDLTYLTSSASLSFTKGSTTLSLPTSVWLANGGAGVWALHVQLITGPDGAPGAIVSFVIGTTTLCSGTTDPGGNLTCDVAPSSVAVRGATFYATFGGDGAYLPAVQTAGTLVNP